MIDSPQVLGSAACHDELIDVFRARKDALGLSNELLDHLIPLANGHTDKLLGPSQLRGLTRPSLDGLLAALGLQLLVAIDPEQSARMKSRWEGKDVRQVRSPTRIAAAMLKRVRPLILSQQGRRAALQRWSRIDPARRRELMRQVSSARKCFVRDRSSDAAAGDSVGTS